MCLDRSVAEGAAGHRSAAAGSSDDTACRTLCARHETMQDITDLRTREGERLELER
jgi:hypothetical protein